MLNEYLLKAENNSVMHPCHDLYKFCDYPVIVSGGGDRNASDFKKTLGLIVNIYELSSLTLDGLVKSPIYFVAGRKQRLAVPHVLPSRRLRYYASYIELFSESIRAVYATFYEIITLEYL